MSFYVHVENYLEDRRDTGKPVTDDKGRVMVSFRITENGNFVVWFALPRDAVVALVHAAIQHVDVSDIQMPQPPHIA